MLCANCCWGYRSGREICIPTEASGHKSVHEAYTPDDMWQCCYRRPGVPARMLNEAGSSLAWRCPKVLILTPESKVAAHSVITEGTRGREHSSCGAPGRARPWCTPGTGTSPGPQNPETCGGKNRFCRMLGANQPCHGSHRKALRGEGA